jgi:hypothetical protein
VVPIGSLANISSHPSINEPNYSFAPSPSISTPTSTLYLSPRSNFNKSS